MWKFYLLFTFIVIVGIFVFLKIFYYFEPSPWCRIKIDEDVVGGNKETIQEAIKSIKGQNPQAYRDLCQYVDLISEKYCQTSKSVKTQTYDTSVKGCYVRGSHSIYLNPDKENNLNVVNERINLIQKYTTLSKNFWQSR